MTSEFKAYRVFKRQMAENGTVGDWTPTAHQFMARSDKEADYKVKKMFGRCDFHHMSLAAKRIFKDQ